MCVNKTFNSTIAATSINIPEGFSEVWIANKNGPEQVVVAGVESSVTQFLSKYVDPKKFRTVPLKVSNAFHTTLMTPAAQDFGVTLQSFRSRIQQTFANTEQRQGCAERSAIDHRDDLKANCPTFVSRKQSQPTRKASMVLAR